MNSQLRAREPGPVRQVLRLLIAPEPGRLHNTLVLVAGVVVILGIWETFRIPEASLACYVVLFVSRNESFTTTVTALVIALSAVVAELLVIVIEMASLSQPALRIGLMALVTFVAMFLNKASKLGPAFFGGGFVAVYGLTVSDSVNSLGVQPGTVTNAASPVDGSPVFLSAPGAGAPEFLFAPPEEALVHMVLWLGLVVVGPAAVVIVLNRLFGIDPVVPLRRGIDDRLAAVEAWCCGEAGAAQRLEAVARRGSPELSKLAGLAAKAHGAKQPMARNQAVIRATTRIMLACLAAEQLSPGERPEWAAAVAAACAAIRSGNAGPVASTAGGPPADDPVGVEAQRAVGELREAQALPDAPPPPEPKQFWAENAFGATNVQYGLKVALTVMICYTLNNALDWPGIGTSVVTCFFVALGTLGESGHKMVLRQAGCIAGAAIGIGSVVLLMPVMTDIGEFMMLMALVTFVGAWIACGSERISYAGWQLGLAFYVTVLQGYGPVTNMETARDRVVGILLGNVVSYVVFAAVWPVRVDRLAAAKLGDALSALARLLRLPEGKGRRRDEDRAREEFAGAVTAAQSLLRDGLFEDEPPDEVHVNEALASNVQALIIPVALLAGAAHSDPAREPLASWFDNISAQLRQGHLRTDDFPPPPTLPPGPAGRARLLLRRVFAPDAEYQSRVNAYCSCTRGCRWDRSHGTLVKGSVMTE